MQIGDVIDGLHDSYFNEFTVSELKYTIRDLKDHLTTVDAHYLGEA